MIRMVIDKLMGKVFAAGYEAGQSGERIHIAWENYTPDEILLEAVHEFLEKHNE